MAHALRLAEKSVGLASPNPAVGCVLIRGGEVAGEGFHEYERLDHAEIAALRQAGTHARGATAYVTLEPCNHQGRTGPCTAALLAAGIHRVVIATRDPNPLVDGRGIARLLAGGAEVSVGVLEHSARKLNEGFARFVRSGLPFVTLKIASSLDGKIAPAGGERAWITGEASREEVQKMRHAADAVVLGVGTVLADNPLLTDRSGLRRRRQLLRVVLDSSLRTPLDSQLVATAEDDVLIFFTDASEAAQQALEKRGVRLRRLVRTCGGAGVPILPALRSLAENGIASVLVEGGSKINAAMLQEDVVDKVVLFFAPVFLGEGAVPMLAGSAGKVSMLEFDLKRFQRDFALEAYLRDPWAGVE
jgi:diaminohydroxyphosphoribosylaminopyrimidine deaminase / 5-amino-6-(5-phosphoribosylamino)uracil reductase